MTRNEIWAEFIKLPLNEQQLFVDSARNLIKMNNTSLRAGAKVCFRNSKTGATISGIFIRMKQKYAEVECSMDKHGLPTPYPMKWSVPPEMLRTVL